jgi:hypothetical protein
MRRFLDWLAVVRVSTARWIDGWWGYDVFIAHRRADATEYALALFDKLQAEKISCFIDRVVYGPGDSLLLATRQHVTKSSLFLLVGSPELLKLRKPVDWVEAEITTYLEAHRESPKVMLVDFGNVIANALKEAGGAATPSHILSSSNSPRSSTFRRTYRPLQAPLRSPSCRDPTQPDGPAT